MSETDPVNQELPPAAIDLDALEREGDPKQPFVFVLEHKRFMMSDPSEVDWQDLLTAMSNPQLFFRYVLPAEDHTAFFASHLATWKVNKLMQEYNRHYGLPDLPNVAGLPR